MVLASDRINRLYGFSTLDAVPATIAAFKQLSVDDQLALLWFVYTELGRSITPAAPGAARLQLVEGVLNEIQSMSHAEQLQVMRDLITQKNTAIGRAYGVLSNNTKLAFWYQLAVWMGDSVVPMPENYRLSSAGQAVFSQLQALEFNQQITALRTVVMDMGVA